MRHCRGGVCLAHGKRGEAIFRTRGDTALSNGRWLKDAPIAHEAAGALLGTLVGSRHIT